MKTCKDCRHHVADKEPGFGFCVYEPPKVVEAGKSAFPVVQSDVTRCGKISPKGIWG